VTTARGSGSGESKGTGLQQRDIRKGIDRIRQHQIQKVQKSAADKPFERAVFA
jgi:hypothetical protein